MKLATAHTEPASAALPPTATPAMSATGGAADSGTQLSLENKRVYPAAQTHALRSGDLTEFKGQTHSPPNVERTNPVSHRQSTSDNANPPTGREFAGQRNSSAHPPPDARGTNPSAHVQPPAVKTNSIVEFGGHSNSFTHAPSTSLYPGLHTQSSTEVGDVSEFGAMLCEFAGQRNRSTHTPPESTNPPAHMQPPAVKTNSVFEFGGHSNTSTHAPSRYMYSGLHTQSSTDAAPYPEVLEFGGQAVTSAQPHSSWAWRTGSDIKRRNKPQPKYILHARFLLVL